MCIYTIIRIYIYTCTYTYIIVYKRGSKLWSRYHGEYGWFLLPFQELGSKIIHNRHACWGTNHFDMFKATRILKNTQTWDEDIIGYLSGLSSPPQKKDKTVYITYYFIILPQAPQAWCVGRNIWSSDRLAPASSQNVEVRRFPLAANWQKEGHRDSTNWWPLAKVTHRKNVPPFGGFMNGILTTDTTIRASSSAIIGIIWALPLLSSLLWRASINWKKMW